jgi:hypothetical protein
LIHGKRYAGLVHGRTKQKLLRATRAGLADGAKTVLWLLSIMIPVSLVIFLLEWFGALAAVSGALSPAFTRIGLPGSAAIVFLSGLLINLYSAIAAMAEIGINLREVTILALVGLSAHNLLVEIPVLASAGAHPLRMTILRLLGAFVAAAGLSTFLPDALEFSLPLFSGGAASSEAGSTFGDAVLQWVVGLGRLVLRVGLVVFVLMIIEQWMQAFGFTKWLGRKLRPLMRLFGLPESVAFLWVVSNTLGLAYGAGVVRREVETGELSRTDGDLWCHHVALSHSLLEDTLLFVALGVPALWITLPRIALAMLAVWERRFELSLRNRS